MSSENIEIQFETGLKTVYYDYQNWNWQETTNTVEYIPPNAKHILSPHEPNSPTPLSFIVNAARGARFGIQTIRIVALGKIYKNNQLTEEIAGAYIDVTLHK